MTILCGPCRSGRSFVGIRTNYKALVVNSYWLLMVIISGQ